MKKNVKISLWIAAGLLMAGIIATTVLLLRPEAPILWPEEGQKVQIGSVEYTYIGKTESVEINKENLKTPFAAQMGEGYYLWNGKETLILHNVSTDSYWYAAVMSSYNIDIILEGENVIDRTVVTQPYEGDEGIGEEGPSTTVHALYFGDGTETGLGQTTIKGDGSLKLRLSTDGEIYAIQTYADLVISEADVSVDMQYFEGISLFEGNYGITSDYDVRLTNGATLEIKNDILIYGRSIKAKNLFIDRSTLKIEGKCHAIETEEDLRITNRSDVQIDFSYGDGDISANGKVYVQNSSLSAIQKLDAETAPFDCFLHANKEITFDHSKISIYGGISTDDLNIINRSNVSVQNDNSEDTSEGTISIHHLYVRKSHLRAETQGAPCIKSYGREGWENNEYAKHPGKIDILEKKLVAPKEYHRITIQPGEREARKYYTLADEQGNPASLLIVKP